jgi:hypothetical protein
VPSGGSVTADVGTSLLRLGALVVLVVVAVGAIGLMVGWFTGARHLDQLARQRRREQEQRAAPPADAAPSPPGVLPAPRPPARRRPAAGHHPVGRRAPGTGSVPVVQPAPVAPPRRPLELVAGDLRRLTHELAMVPGGMPMARRRGLLAAFDDVLVEAAQLLQVPSDQLTGAPEAARELERMRLLASLEAAGLVVSG